MKNWTYWIVVTLLLYGFLEFFSFGSLVFLRRERQLEYMPVDRVSREHQHIIRNFLSQKTQYISFHPVLGWSTQKNGTSELYQTNSSGIRSDREYSPAQAPGVLRLSSFGDSYTHSDEVKNKETWQAVMESLTANIEVLNFGVCGYGLDQAYLRYQLDGRQFQSDIVLIGYMTENIKRNVNRYRPFYAPVTSLPLTKPRFLVQEGNLTLVPNAMSRLHDYTTLLSDPEKTLPLIGHNDHFYKKRYTAHPLDWSPTVRLSIVLYHYYHTKQPVDDIIVNGKYDTNTEAFQVTKKIFETFYRETISNGSRALIVVFPTKQDMIRFRKGKKKRYSPLLNYFDTAGYHYLDTMEAFNNVEINDVFGVSHYSPLANRLVGQYILDYLKKNAAGQL